MGDINSFGELENLVQPFFYSGVTPLPEVPPGSPPVHHSNTTKGFISEDCLLGGFYNQGVIQCFSVDTKLSDTHYTPKSHVPICVPETPYAFPPRCVITCSSEFMHNQRASRGVRKLLLGLNCTGVAPHYNLGGGNGALAIYDPIQRQVIKWISVPHPVTTVRVISHYERGDVIKPFYNGAMMAMVGIAAVGMVGGEVSIVDLGLDRTDFLPPTGIVLFSSLAPQLQSKPFKTLAVDPFDRLIAMKRHNAINKSHLICLSLSDDDGQPYDENVFIYRNKLGIEIERFDRQDVSITAVEYISNIGCLLVGYSFGGFQIWKVDDLSLQYSSMLPVSDLSVLSFGFQQPLDDPKNFCYIWVLYGAPNLIQSQSHLDLYQLFFLEKSQIDNFGYIYQDLQKCAKNLSITLEDVQLPRNCEDSEDGSMTEESDRYLVHPMRLWIMDELVFISWGVQRLGVFYVGIFDLNQWYSSHTSASIPTGGLCSFWVTIPVQRSGSDGIPWDFRLVPSSLVRWENSYKPQDVHLYPASITFQGVSLTSDGLFCFEHFGLQEKIIRFILRDGHTEMSEPFQLRHICHTYGLQPVTSSIYEPDTLSPKDIERFYIFTALLESKRPALIVKMANIWLDGSFANVGCTIDLIIDWVRNLALAVRYLAEEHWYNTFNLQADHMLPETKKFISYSNFIWNSLYSLLKTLIRHDEVYNVSRIPALNDLRLSLEKLVQYSSAILLFCQAGILPSRDDIIDKLVEYYDRRRLEVREALNNCDIIPEDMKQNHPCLVIDQIFSNFGEDFVRREWNIEPTEPLYPPRHAGYVVNMLMWRDIDSNLISRVIFYFIIDFLKIQGCLSSEVKGDFLSVISLTPEDREELFNLWKVDHEYLQQPMSYLCQSQKFYNRNEIGTTWSVAASILTAMGAQHNTTDLYRSGCPPFLGKLYINVMAESRERFRCLMDEVCSQYSVVLADTELIQHFFKVALQKGYLEEFINTKVKHTPESTLSELVTFLEKTSSFDNQNLLVTYYIKSDNYEKAHQVHRNMKVFWSGGLALNAMQKTIWNGQLEMMKKLPVKKQESTIQNFLKMKSTNERVVKPTQTVTIKPVRILELCEPVSMNFEQIQKPHNFLTQYQMSPLRRYIPQTVVMSKSPSNVERSLNNSLNEENEALSSTPTSTEPRRSISFDVESVLKTPTFDHRHSRRLQSTPESSKTNNSMYETPPNADEVHSILKKTEGSVKNKTLLKTRFLDPTSGAEMTSPDDSMNEVLLSCEDEGENSIDDENNIQQPTVATAIVPTVVSDDEMMDAENESSQETLNSSADDVLAHEISQPIPASVNDEKVDQEEENGFEESPIDDGDELNNGLENSTISSESDNEEEDEDLESSPETLDSSTEDVLNNGLLQSNTISGSENELVEEEVESNPEMIDDVLLPSIVASGSDNETVDREAAKGPEVLESPIDDELNNILQPIVASGIDDVTIEQENDRDLFAIPADVPPIIEENELEVCTSPTVGDISQPMVDGDAENQENSKEDSSTDDVLNKGLLLSSVGSDNDNETEGHDSSREVFESPKADVNLIVANDSDNEIGEHNSSGELYESPKGEGLNTILQPNSSVGSDNETVGQAEESREVLENIVSSVEDQSRHDNINRFRALLRTKVPQSSIEQFSIPDENMNENHTEDDTTVERSNVVLPFVSSGKNTISSQEIESTQEVVASSDCESVDSSSHRVTRRSGRRNMRPMADFAPTVPEKRLTRSQARKLSYSDGHESDQSFSGDDHNLSITSAPTIQARRRKTLSTVDEKDHESDQSFSGDNLSITSAPTTRLRRRKALDAVDEKGHESDQSFSGDDHNLSKSAPTTRSRRRKSLATVDEAGHESDESELSISSVTTRSRRRKAMEEKEEEDTSPSITLNSLRSRSKSESPARVLNDEPPPKRKRGRRVMDFSLDLTTVMETTDASNILEISDDLD